MSSVHFLVRACRIMLVLVWVTFAGVAYAAVTFSSSGTTIVLDPTISWLSVFMSTLAGGSALFIRLDKKISEAEAARIASAKSGVTEPAEPFRLHRIVLFLGMHMFGSWTSGTVAFVMARAYDWNIWYGLLVIALGSFMGATFLERAAEKVLANPIAPPPQTKAP